MDLNWYQGILYGFVSGICDILPVCASSHQMLLLKVFGKTRAPGLMDLLIHISILAAVYYHCMPHITKMLRAKSLSRIPKRRRKRPLDTKSLMDLSLWITMIVPVILAFLFYGKTTALRGSLSLMAVFLFLNGVILYVPQYLPSSNKDSRTLSRVEGLLMGLGGAASILPGISAVGAAASVGSVCGVERKYCLNMALLMNLAVSAALVVHDFLAVASAGSDVFSFLGVLISVLAAVAAFIGTTLAIRFMRRLAGGQGYGIFAYYCWGVALFTFVLNLMA